jgi:hypothetical protein
MRYPPFVTTYEVRAFNTAVASDNKIHDDAVRQQFGFRGGLVPGVEVYAYLAHSRIDAVHPQSMRCRSANCPANGLKRVRVRSRRGVRSALHR